MYAVAFDLVVADTRKHHSTGDPSAACRDIYEVLVTRHGFEWKQGSLYILDDAEGHARLYWWACALQEWYTRNLPSAAIRPMVVVRSLVRHTAAGATC